MKELVRKLTSRKLWAAAAGMAAGLAMAFGLDEEIVSSVAGAVVALGSTAAYIAAEGRLDAERIRAAAQAVQNAADKLERSDDDRA